jgi:ribosomal protein S18 acetylase RimI-like enzyme
VAHSSRSRRSRTSEPVLVRRATAEDAAEIARIRGQTWRVAYSQIFTREQLDTISEDGDAERWRQILEEEHHRSQPLVALRDDRAEGFAAFGPEDFRDDSDIGELYAIYVLPEASGQGIGQTLMRETLARLRAAAFGEAVLWVFEDNSRTRRFYELAGCETDGTVKDEEWLGTTPRAVRYRIQLLPR